MKKEVLHMKIDAELKRSLQELAQRENRNLSNMIETILKERLRGLVDTRQDQEAGKQ